MSELERCGRSILMHQSVYPSQQLDTAAAPLHDLLAQRPDRSHLHSKHISVIGMKLSISIDVSVRAKKWIEILEYYIKLASYMILMSQAL